MFGLGSRKQTESDRTKVVGLDLDATRARASVLSAGRTRPILLEESSEELPLFLHLDRRPPAVGAAAVAVCRKLPHFVCSNFLPQLGHSRQWQTGRATVTPEAALQATFEALVRPLTAEAGEVGLALPLYLTAAQVKAVLQVAARAKLAVRGPVAAPLAVAAHRAGWVLGARTDTPPPAEGRPDWVVPIRQSSHGPPAVVIVDADEFALTASVVGFDPTEVKVLASAAWPKASLKLWKDRLIDALSDRCVRLCRRDPRDSADAEQGLYEQLDEALDRGRAGRPVTLTIRADHWYQDLMHQPDDLDGFCAALAKAGADGVAELVRSANLPVPPRAVWLSHAAARLPGLAAAIHHTSPEQTEVLALPPNAVADAVAVLVPMWLTGMIPRAHLDVAIPLPPTAYTRDALAEHGTPARSPAPHG